MSLGAIAPNRGILILAGVFVALGMIVIAAWFVLTVGRPGARVSYQASLPEVGGLRVGTPVQIAGYPVGAIRFIKPERYSQPVSFRIDLSLDPDWRLPEDSTVATGSDGLLSAPIIALELGRSTTVITPGGRIKSRPAPLSLAAEVRAVLIEDVRPTLQSIRNSVENDLNPATRSLRTTADAATAAIEHNLAPLLADTRSVVAELRDAAPGLRAKLEALAHGLGEAGALLDQVGTPENATRINALLADVKAASGRLEGVVKDAGQALETADTLLGRVDGVVRQNQGGIGTIVRDARFSLATLASSLGLILANLERTTQDLSGLAAELRANPGVVLQGRAADRRPGVQPK